MPRRVRGEAEGVAAQPAEQRCSILEAASCCPLQDTVSRTMPGSRIRSRMDSAYAAT